MIPFRTPGAMLSCRIEIDSILLTPHRRICVLTRPKTYGSAIRVTVHGFWGSFGGFWSEICIMR